MESNSSLEIEFRTHEAQCEERWVTTFRRLDKIEKTLNRMESRILTMGGTVCLFLAGVIVTLMQVGG